MKKPIGILLVALIFLSIISFIPTIQVVHAQLEEEWPNRDINGDGNIDIEDAIQYLKDNFVSYDEQSESFYWSFTDPYDITMANAFIKSIFEVEYIRSANDDITILGFLDRAANTPGGMKFENFDGTISTISSE